MTMHPAIPTKYGTETVTRASQDAESNNIEVTIPKVYPSRRKALRAKREAMDTDGTSLRCKND